MNHQSNIRTTRQGNVFPFQTLRVAQQLVTVSTKGDDMKKTVTASLCLVSALGLALASPADAGTAAGKVKELHVRASDGLIVVILNSPRYGKPSCATQDYFIVRDGNSHTGEAQFAMLTAAFLNGTTVFITGSNACTRWLDGEDIEDVYYRN